MKIDFFCQHLGHKEIAQSIFTELEKRGHECIWNIGMDSVGTSTECAFLVDHPNQQKWLLNNRPDLLFYYPHDLLDFKGHGDLSIFSHIFCPSYNWLVNSKIYDFNENYSIVGWTKYDSIRNDPTVKGAIKSLPHEITVIYAPSDERGEGLDVVRIFEKLDINVVFKYGAYLYDENFLKINYPEILIEVDGKKRNKILVKIEQACSELENMVFLDPSNTIIEIGKYCDVLISDYSSTLIEFLPFGQSIQTRMDKNGLLWGVKKIPLKIQSLERFIIRKLKKFARKKNREKIVENLYLPLNYVLKEMPYSKAIDWVAAPRLEDYFRSYSPQVSATNWSEVYGWLFKLDGNVALRIVDEMEKIIC